MISININETIASGLDMTPTGFMNGNYVFREIQGIDGFVANVGIVTARTGGNMTSLGKMIRNDGLESCSM